MAETATGGVSATLTNNTKSDLVLMHRQLWSGNWQPDQGPARLIKAGYGSRFASIAQLPAGSKAGVKYAARGHQWILVWHVPLQTEGQRVTNKVYFQDRPESEVDWDEIESILDGRVTPPPSSYPAGSATITNNAIAVMAAAFTEPTN